MKRLGILVYIIIEKKVMVKNMSKYIVIARIFPMHSPVLLKAKENF